MENNFGAQKLNGCNARHTCNYNGYDTGHVSTCGNNPS